MSELHSGDQVKITGYAKVNPAYRQKLLAMGLTPGTVFVVSRIAPLGDPIEIQVRGYALSLRRHEALALLVEKV